MKPIAGSIVALVTPMHEDGSIDDAGLRKLIDWHVLEGTQCIAAVGTTGESPTVTVEEHCEIIRATVEQAAGRIAVMAGTGGNSTAEAVDIPMVLYNVPGRTVADLQTETTLRLAQVPGIVGIKDATADIERGAM